jgi:hypothetical protein
MKRTKNGEHALLREVLIDELDSIFEARWTVPGTDGESSLLLMKPWWQQTIQHTEECRFRDLLDFRPV